MRIGIFGGAFNPPHIGHLKLAQEATEKLKLDRLIYVICGQPLHKDSKDFIGSLYRKHMLELLTNKTGLISMIEAFLKFPSYTINTLRVFKETYPEDELFLILGSDEGIQLNTWHEAEKIPYFATVCVFNRGNISSTDIRERIRNGVPITNFVTAGVEDYIKRNDFYIN